jgi:hypothetical protein
MYKHIKSPYVLASVIAMILSLPCSIALANEGRYNNPGQHGSPGWSGHHEGYHRYYTAYHAPYNRGQHRVYYTHYYPRQTSCGTCALKNRHHHNNHNHHWWHFW